MSEDIAATQQECRLGAQVGALLRCPMGRCSLLVHAMGAISTGLAAWVVLLLAGRASTVEILGWTAAAWLAWSMVIALKLWIWSRENAISIISER